MVEESVNSLWQSELKYNGWRQTQKTITFVGGTVNGIGNFDGTGDPFTIFNVDGEVLVRVFGVCLTDLVGATATLQVGVNATGQFGELIPSTLATDIDAKELWVTATPTKFIELSSAVAEKIIVNGADIVGEVGTANITAGVIRFVCLWKSFSQDGNVVAA